MQFWNAKCLQWSIVIRAHAPRQVHRLAFDNRGYHLLSTGEDEHLMLWTVKTQAAPAAAEPAEPAQPAQPTERPRPAPAAAAAGAAPTLAAESDAAASAMTPPTVAYLAPQTLLCCEPSALSMRDLEGDAAPRTIGSARTQVPARLFIDTPCP